MTTPIEAGLIGTGIGITIMIFGFMGYSLAKDEFERYVRSEIRDAKSELRDYVRENYERDHS